MIEVNVRGGGIMLSLILQMILEQLLVTFVTALVGAVA
jgi:hypothetical protein